MNLRRRLIQTPAAQNDLLDIYESIAIERPIAAERLVGKIYSAIERVVGFPESNVDRSDFAPGLRILKVRPYLVFYSFDAEEFLVVRVLHGARDIGEIDLTLPHRR